MEAKFTPTQQRILAVLEDGYAHPVSELQTCLDDELAGHSALLFHISTLRKTLKRMGQDIIAKHNGRGKAHYIWVRLIGKNAE